MNWKDRVRTLHAILRNNLFPTEAAWNVDEAFLNGMDMRFLPRLGVAALCKSWWLVPPRLVAEMLKLLGFGDVKWDYHDEWFYGSDGERTPRMVRHYTVTGTRLSYNVRFGEGWHSAETNGTESWRWSNSSHARLMLEIGNKKRGLGSLTLSVRSLAPCHLSITLNGGLISDFDCFGLMQRVVDGVHFEPGSNLIDILSDKPPTQGSRKDSRHLGFALYHLGCVLA